MIKNDIIEPVNGGMKMKEIVISKENAGQRVDKFVRKFLNDAPLSLLYKTFRKKDVKVNGHWVDIQYILKENDCLRIYLSDEIIAEYSHPKVVETLPFTHPILYEDENILAVLKPSGLLVHGDETEKRITLANQVLSYLMQKGEYQPTIQHGFIPAPAHRLDRNTSGIVLFGKNLPSLQALFDLFKTKDQITKKYIALVVGNVEKDGEIKAPLIKDEKEGKVRIGSLKEGAKEAYTKYHVLKKYKNYTLLEIEIRTGRTHQIRVHMASIGHPVAGDPKYGHFKQNREFKEKYHYDSQFLHAYSITFHKIEGPLSYLSYRTIEAPLCEKEEKILQHL